MSIDPSPMPDTATPSVDASSASADELAALQELACSELEKTVSRVAAMLADDAPAAKGAAVSGAGGLDALAAAARMRRQAALERRELALDLVVGALLNEHNPDWDPADPSSSRASSDGIVLRLLRRAF